MPVWIRVHRRDFRKFYGECLRQCEISREGQQRYHRTGERRRVGSGVIDQWDGDGRGRLLRLEREPRAHPARLSRPSPPLIAPRRLVTYRDVEYPIYQRGEAWVIEVAGGTYFLTAGNDPTLQARRWLGKLPRNSIWPHTPAVLASEISPLILDVDGAIIRAWPVQLPEEPERTYEHPYWRHRVVAVHQQPVWMFAARGRQRSHHGEASSEQTVADVEQLAREWLSRSAAGS